MCKETCLNQKNVYKWVKRVYHLSQSQKESAKWKHWISSREKTSDTAVNKESHADSLQWHEKIYYYSFP